MSTRIPAVISNSVSTISPTLSPTLSLPPQRNLFQSVRAWIARHPARAYLIMAFLFAWSSMIPLLLSQQGFGLLPIEMPIPFFTSLASFVGLALPAFLVAAASEGKAGVYALLRQSLRWRVGLQWYLIALFGTLAATLIVALPFVGLAPLQMLVQHWSLFFTLFLPAVLLPFLHTNLAEEIGWTTLQARLQEGHGPLKASLIVAPFFTLMHLPAYFVPGWIADERMALPELAVTLGITMLFAYFFRLILLWLYNSTGGSLLIAGLFHSAFNVYSGQAFTPTFITTPDPTWLNFLVLGAVMLAAQLITFITKGRLGYKNT